MPGDESFGEQSVVAGWLFGDEWALEMRVVEITPTNARDERPQKNGFS